MEVNPQTITHILLEKYGESPGGSIPNEREKELARVICDIIQESMHSCVTVEEDHELVFQDPLFAEDQREELTEELADDFLHEVQCGELTESEESVSIGESQPSSASCHGTPSPINRTPRSDIPFSKRKRAVDHWRDVLPPRKRRSISSMTSRFRFVSSERQLETWEKQLAQEGPTHEKLCKLVNHLKQRCAVARNEKKSIHDVDLRRWALVESRQLSLTNFKASHDYIRLLKKTIGIGSRKVTKFVSRGSSGKDENVVTSAMNFVNSVKPDIDVYLPDNVYNSDQSGFSLEMHGGRTLEFIGARRVEVLAQSVAATTHSYTIMPTISASGKLLSPLVIVFKEKDGKFGQHVESTMQKPKNVLSIAAKSSIMGKTEIRRWYEEAFLPNCSSSSMLLVDSLRAYSCVADSNTVGKKVEIRAIPSHATGIAQPLDVFFFRIWKTFSRKISEFIILEDAEIFLRQRDNIIRMQSLIHNQLAAPRFLTFRQQAWYKSGYLTGQAPEFVHPINYCFKTNELFCCKCSDMKLLKCAWCEQNLCIKHAFTDMHFHDM